MLCCCPRLLLLAACALLLRPTPYTHASPSSGVELRFGGYPGLACADGRYPVALDNARRMLVALLVVGADDRIHRTFGCSFEGDIRQLQAMAAEHGFRFISLLPPSVSLAIPEADCVVPRPGLPNDVFDVQMNLLGAAAPAAPAGCLMYSSAKVGLVSRSATNSTDSDAATDDPPADGALLLRFQRVSFPALECRFRAQTQPDVILRGLVQPPDDHFTCRFRYRIKGQVLGALLRYLSAAYRLPLDTPPASLPMLTLRPFACGAGAADDADVDFLVTGPRGRSAGCKFSSGDHQSSG
ncbi:uncharacterized protein LOC126100888 [Schistocerca cancellata]|uniref:uncharacterized protein LOC126100888 n=1 Tax=Schistocerca cancellata TaxID=274614 RepID=UPI0021189A55|nr:uncharacterized protein LOC126100888 [Schistocerca cancellata]